MACTYVSLVAVLLFVSPLLVAHAEPTTVAVCDTVKGFAGELNYQFSLIVSTPPREGEAIVLVARAVPFIEGSTLPLPQMSATYKLLGVDTPVVADRTGMLQIADAVEADTLVNVTISNLRADGPTPFLFYSFHAGYRSCSLVLSPGSSFSGPIPLHVSNTNNPALVYLKATPPPTAKNFALQVRGNALAAYSPKEHENGAVWGAEMAAAPIPTVGQPIYFTVRLREGVTASEFVHINLRWISASGEEASPPPAPGTPLAGEPPAAATPQPDVWKAPTPPAAGPSSSNTRAKVAEGTSIPVVLFVLVLAYFVVRSVYNYRVQHITDFPKYVPHHEVFSAVGTFCGSLGSHIRNRGRGGFLNRGAYSDVDREEMPAY